VGRAGGARFFREPSVSGQDIIALSCRARVSPKKETCILESEQIEVFRGIKTFQSCVLCFCRYLFEEVP
jgi:hypothetical protein